MLPIKMLPHTNTNQPRPTLQVSEGEAGLLAGTWPRARDLVHLQEECLEVLYSLRGEGPAPGDARRARTCATLAKVRASVWRCAQRGALRP